MSEPVWATVTTAGPLPGLRVLIDGDPHPLPTPPHDCLTDPAALAVGDRVRCEWERTRGGHRLTVLGRAGGTSALGAYPVGAIYMSINPAHPATLFGGQWAVWGTGRVAVGVDPADPDFATPGQVGGTKAVTLTVEQMPSHTHTQDAHSHTSAAHAHSINHGHTASTGSAGEHTHNAMQNPNINGNVISGGSGAGWSSSAAGGWQLGSGPLGSAGAHTHTVTVANHSGNSGTTTPPATGATATPIGSTGGSQPHNNLQPYIACFMWVRTA